MTFLNPETIGPNACFGSFSKEKLVPIHESTARYLKLSWWSIQKYFALVLLLIAACALRAQDQQARKIYIELKPFQFISGGYSVVGHYALNDQWHVGANVFASELSEGLHELVFNFDEAIALQANQNLAINVSFRYFLNKEKGAKGWVASVPLGYERWTLTDNNIDQEVAYEYWYLSPRIGYLWYPFKKERFYVIGEVIGVVPIITDGEVDLGPSGIELRSFIPIGGLGLGYRF